jgi:hypothetical protein
LQQLVVSFILSAVRLQQQQLHYQRLGVISCALIAAWHSSDASNAPTLAVLNQCGRKVFTSEAAVAQKPQYK